MNSSDETFSLEVFVWHLAAHLCGAQALHPQDPKDGGFRLYWRSSPLLCSSSTENGETKKRSCAFVDATFEFACWNKEEEDEPNETTTPLIRMHWGSLWLGPNSSSSSSAAGASYYTGQAVTVQNLDDHFAAFAIDLDSTPAAVLAKQMAKALQGLSSSSAQETISSSFSISLFYADFQQSAALELVFPAAPVEARPHSSPVDEALLHMLLLQHSYSARQQSTLPDEVTEKDLAQLSNYIENEWKPLFRRRGSPSEPETKTTVAAAPSPPAASLDETDNNPKTDSAKKKKVPGGASRKPVSFQPKGRQHGTAQIGGHRKKQKKNNKKEGGMAGLYG